MTEPPANQTLINLVNARPPQRYPHGIIAVDVVPIGGLQITSGRVVACDPLFMAGAKAFVRRVPAGTYQVTLFIARFSSGDERVAAATLTFGNDAPTRWEHALCPGDDPADLNDGEFFGYGVDSGTGGFMDAVAAELLAKRLSDDESYADRIIDEMEQVYQPTRSWGVLRLSEAGPNFAAFSSGLGDGSYGSWLGVIDDRVVTLLTDFGAFYEEA